MDKIEEIFAQRIEEFKSNPNEIKTEKTLFFFRRGLEEQYKLSQIHWPAIGAEGHFKRVQGENYPNEEECEFCERAFCLGFFADLRLRI